MHFLSDRTFFATILNKPLGVYDSSGSMVLGGFFFSKANLNLRYGIVNLILFSISKLNRGIIKVDDLTNKQAKDHNLNKLPNESHRPTK